MIITKGTPKQIVWAEKIRATMEECFIALEAKYGPAPEVVKEYVTKEYLGREDARYYIDGWGRWGKITPTDIIKTLCEKAPDAIADAAFEWSIAGIRK